MVGVRTATRLSAAVLAAVAGFAGTLAFHSTAHADTPSQAAVSAARWAAGEVTEEGAIPGMVGLPDWGLTVDTLIALEATGADEAVADRMTEALKLHVRDYNSLDAWSTKGQYIAGATAKLLYAAVISDSDPEEFGRYNLRQETLDLLAGPEAHLEEGRIKDRVDPPSTDSSNTFAQALAVLGLARSGGVPQSAVDFLLDQQCASGGFRLYPYAFGGGGVTGDCDAQGGAAVLDPDSTGMAIQALLAAAEHSDSVGAQEAARQGADWLKEIQNADGSFGGSGPTAAANSNSTGLAGQALAATGFQAEAAKASDWVRGLQIIGDNAGRATSELGTIAYNAEALASAQAEGIPDFQRDQWRRATPQALLTLAQVSLADIGENEPDPGPEPTDPPGSGATPPDTSTPATHGGDKTLPVTGSPALPIAVTGAAFIAVGILLHQAAHRKQATRR